MPGLGEGSLQDKFTRLVDENRELRNELAALRLRLDVVERLADMDTLTPLPNRRCFVRQVERVVSQVARYGEVATVVFVDVDGLKSINDHHGHSAGDAALIHVASVLRSEVRAGDLVARIGGDEFGLLLDHLDEVSATAKAVALMAALQASPLELGQVSLTIGLSMGLAMVKPEDTVETLLARADGRMYAAKAAQRSER
ncbi:GGDEF domain-containing protein [Sphingomonas sp.]|uniref:GGDEF domain-containing protein n=1 Tax=Sphingomonas sp. TaxID=28214 RepID=UPI0025F1F0F6|nr:GGDEF domain-containing protein [Sphingomonas sp.]